MLPTEVDDGVGDCKDTEPSPREKEEATKKRLFDM